MELAARPCDSSRNRPSQGKRASHRRTGCGALTGPSTSARWLLRSLVKACRQHQAGTLSGLVPPRADGSCSEDDVDQRRGSVAVEIRADDIRRASLPSRANRTSMLAHEALPPAGPVSSPVTRMVYVSPTSPVCGRLCSASGRATVRSARQVVGRDQSRLSGPPSASPAPAPRHQPDAREPVVSTARRSGDACAEWLASRADHDRLAFIRDRANRAASRPVTTEALVRAATAAGAPGALRR